MSIPGKERPPDDFSWVAGDRPIPRLIIRPVSWRDQVPDHWRRSPCRDRLHRFAAHHRTGLCTTTRSGDAAQSRRSDRVVW